MSYFHHYDEVNDLLLCSHSSTFTFGSHLKQYSKHTTPHSNILTHYLNQSRQKKKKKKVEAGKKTFHTNENWDEHIYYIRYFNPCFESVKE